MFSHRFVIWNEKKQPSNKSYKHLFLLFQCNKVKFIPKDTTLMVSLAEVITGEETYSVQCKVSNSPLGEGFVLFKQIFQTDDNGSVAHPLNITLSRGLWGQMYKVLERFFSAGGLLGSAEELL